MNIIHNQRTIAPVLPTMIAQARLYEIHDALVLALDATERSNGYSPSEREAREHIRVALRHAIKLQEGQA